jgi:hypothetical protein
MKPALRFIPAVASLAFAFVMSSAVAQAAPASNIATYKGADRDSSILAGARREGKVVFYSGMIENQALRPIADALKKNIPSSRWNIGAETVAPWCRRP